MWRSFIGAFLALSLSSAATAQAPDHLRLGAAAYGDGNYPEALKNFRIAAAQGDALAQAQLGSMYANGKGVPEDFVQAYMWYNLAAAQGNATARENREAIRKRMTPAQIAEGQRLSAQAVR